MEFAGCANCGQEIMRKNGAVNGGEVEQEDSVSIGGTQTVRTNFPETWIWLDAKTEYVL